MNITEFQKSRFGLFIHWGIYSIPARGEWVRSNEEMKEEDYIPLCAPSQLFAHAGYLTTACCHQPLL